jgi:hypothetical protein
MSGGCQSSAEMVFSGIEKVSETAADVNKTWLRITMSIMNPNNRGNHDAFKNFMIQRIN